MTTKADLRRAAKAAGLTQFQNGRDCPNGHPNPIRNVCDGACLICKRARTKEIVKNSPELLEKARLRARKYYNEHWDIQREKGRERWRSEIGPRLKAERAERAAKREKTPKEIAILAGAKTYLGTPCKYGHDGTRMTSTNGCRGCLRDREKNSISADPARIAAKTNGEETYWNGKPCVRGHTDGRRTLTGKCISCAKARYHERISEVDGFRGRMNHNSKVRHYAKINRTPLWADMEKIKEIYKNCPKGWHVDHIIPLQGENVSGLHVHNNLQPLPGRENMSKNNKFEVIIEYYDNVKGLQSAD